MKHTPGPWSVDSHGGVAVIPGEAEIDTRAGTEVGRANARLIAAAPEMYGALKDLVSLIQHWRETGAPNLGAIMAAQEVAQLVLEKSDKGSP